MDYGEALTAIEGSEIDASQKNSIVKAIKDHLQSVLSQKHRASSRSTQLEESLDALLVSLGAEGESVEDRLTSAKKKLGELKTKSTQSDQDKEVWQQEKAALEGKISQFEEQISKQSKEVTLRDVATKLGYNLTVLSHLADVNKLEFKLDGDQVKILVKEGETTTEKPFKEYFDATPSLKVFEPALLAKNQNAGGTGGTDGEDKSNGGTSNSKQQSRRPTEIGGAEQQNKQGGVLDRHLASKYALPTVSTDK